LKCRENRGGWGKSSDTEAEIKGKLSESEAGINQAAK